MGGYFRFHNWNESVSIGNEYNIPVYGCLETARIQGKLRGGLALKKWRCEAMQAWNAGMDGLYTFNAFNPRAQIYREIGNPTLLKTLQRVKSVPGINPNLWTTPGKWLINGHDYIDYS
jgi:hypothetical protein